jgi:hypothetical protein
MKMQSRILKLVKFNNVEHAQKTANIIKLQK